MSENLNPVSNEKIGYSLVGKVSSYRFQSDFCVQFLLTGRESFYVPDARVKEKRLNLSEDIVSERERFAVNPCGLK